MRLPYEPLRGFAGFHSKQRWKRACNGGHVCYSSSMCLIVHVHCFCMFRTVCTVDHIRQAFFSLNAAMNRMHIVQQHGLPNCTMARSLALCTCQHVVYLGCCFDVACRLVLKMMVMLLVMNHWQEVSSGSPASRHESDTEGSTTGVGKTKLVQLKQQHTGRATGVAAPA